MALIGRQTVVLLLAVFAGFVFSSDPVLDKKKDEDLEFYKIFLIVAVIFCILLSIECLGLLFIGIRNARLSAQLNSAQEEFTRAHDTTVDLHSQIEVLEASIVAEKRAINKIAGKLNKPEHIERVANPIHNAHPKPERKRHSKNIDRQSRQGKEKAHPNNCVEQTRRDADETRRGESVASRRVESIASRKSESLR